MSDDRQRIEQEIRAWVNRPPARSPRVARTRVLARLEERRPWAGWRPVAAAAMILVAILAATLFLRSSESSFEKGTTIVDGAPPPPPPPTPPPTPAAGLLVYELSSGTKLYLTLGESRAPDSAPGS